LRWPRRGIDSSIDAMKYIGWFLLAGLPALVQAHQDATHPRVRPIDESARSLVSDAARRSPTVARVLDALEQHDVVVYVTTELNLPSRGVLTFVAHAASLTYVLVRVDLKQTIDSRTSSLAHELTHALEVAEAARPILNEADLDALYREIGIVERHGEFESARAIAIESAVRADLRSATTKRRS
jgi:hypothetical protein